MATIKTAMLTFRIVPGLKEALRIAADQEHRFIANLAALIHDAGDGRTTEKPTFRGVRE